MPDDSISLRETFLQVNPTKTEVIFGRIKAYSLPLDHAVSRFMGHLIEATRTGSYGPLVALLADLTAVPPRDDVIYLLQTILSQMKNPALSTQDMRTWCRLYQGLVELLPECPWLYGLMLSIISHAEDEAPDRMLEVLYEVYQRRERIRQEQKHKLVVAWSGRNLRSYFEKQEDGLDMDDFADTNGQIPALILSGDVAPTKKSGPRLLRLPARFLPRKATSS